jgi:hypothetical protein
MPITTGADQPPAMKRILGLGAECRLSHLPDWNGSCAAYSSMIIASYVVLSPFPLLPGLMTLDDESYSALPMLTQSFLPFMLN